MDVAKCGFKDAMLADCPKESHKALLRCLSSKDPRTYQNEKGRNLLMEYLVCAKPIGADIVKFMVEEIQIDLRQICFDEWNCLLWACANPTLTFDVVQVLLSSPDCNVNHTDSYNRSSMQQYLYNNDCVDEDIVMLLNSKGYDFRKLSPTILPIFLEIFVHNKKLPETVMMIFFHE
jgi:hypothetical protein